MPRPPTSSEWFIALEAVVLVVGVAAGLISRPLLRGAGAARRVAVVAFATLGAGLVVVTVVAVAAGLRASRVDLAPDLAIEQRNFPTNPIAARLVGLDPHSTEHVAGYLAAMALPLAALCIVSAVIVRYAAPRTTLRWAATAVAAFVLALGVLLGIHDTGGIAGGAAWFAANVALVGLLAIGYEHLHSAGAAVEPAAVLDHIVYAVPDLDAACADLALRLGVAPVAGGRHDGRGTHNALLGLGGGAYLEVIAPDPGQDEPEGGRTFGVSAATRPAIVAWAARTPDIDATIAAATAAGHDPGPVLAMSRLRPDGVLLQWRLTLPAGGDVIPFLIDWGRTPHPSAGIPAADLLAFELSHPDPAATADHLTALGLELAGPIVAAPLPSLRATLRGPAGTLDL